MKKLTLLFTWLIIAYSSLAQVVYDVLASSTSIDDDCLPLEFSPTAHRVVSVISKQN